MAICLGLFGATSSAPAFEAKDNQSRFVTFYECERVFEPASKGLPQTSTQPTGKNPRRLKALDQIGLDPTKVHYIFGDDPSPKSPENAKALEFVDRVLEAMIQTADSDQPTIRDQVYIAHKGTAKAARRLIGEARAEGYPTLKVARAIKIYLAIQHFVSQAGESVAANLSPNERKVFLEQLGRTEEELFGKDPENSRIQKLDRSALGFLYAQTARTKVMVEHQFENSLLKFLLSPSSKFKRMSDLFEGMSLDDMGGADTTQNRAFLRPVYIVGHVGLEPLLFQNPLGLNISMITAQMEFVDGHWRCPFYAEEHDSGNHGTLARFGWMFSKYYARKMETGDSVDGKAGIIAREEKALGQFWKIIENMRAIQDPNLKSAVRLLIFEATHEVSQLHLQNAPLLELFDHLKNTPNPVKWPKDPTVDAPDGGFAWALANTKDLESTTRSYAKRLLLSIESAVYDHPYIYDRTIDWSKTSREEFRANFLQGFQWLKAQAKEIEKTGSDPFW